MKIKGHSIIELRNVKTGEVERFEDDNIVTNAFDLYIQDLGMLNVSPMFNDSVRNDIIDTLMGGLLLFKENIIESADTVICPGGMTMIGNGAYNVTADGADGVTELGSWNSIESGYMSDGSYKMVWDFSTVQANGTINCACLTSARHGYIGEGNATSGASRSNKDSDIYTTGTAQDYNHFDNNDMIYRTVRVNRANSSATYISYNNIVYNAATASEHMGTTGKVKLITKKIPISKVDRRMSWNNSTSGELYMGNISEVELTLPTAFKNALGNNQPWLYGRYGGNYYMIATSLNGLTPNNSVQGVKISSDNTVTGFTITNTEDFTFGADARCVAFGGNQVAIVLNNGKILFQDITNNADTDVIECAPNYSDRYFKCFCYDGYFIIAGYKVDFVNKNAYPINALYGVNYCAAMVDDNPLVVNEVPYNHGYEGSHTFRLYKSTNYLATINNLQSQVTKTAGKTMKVTYVLRFGE